MGATSEHDAWDLGRSYDEYMGRWSRAVADVFLRRLAPDVRTRWADIGCGTGALTARIVSMCDPLSITGIDPSAGFVALAAEHVGGQTAAHAGTGTARFEVGSAAAVPLAEDAVDIVTSALAYNFFPDRPAALAEFRRITRPGGTLAFYVWDYPGGGVEFIDEFWKHASRLDPAAATLDEADRFPFCTADDLAVEVTAAGFADVTVEPIVVATPFADFDAFWSPFTLGAGPAPGYLASLDPDSRGRLRASLAAGLRERVTELTARAWAVTAASP